MIDLSPWPKVKFVYAAFLRLGQTNVRNRASFVAPPRFQKATKLPTKFVVRNLSNKIEGVQILYGKIIVDVPGVEVL